MQQQQQQPQNQKEQEQGQLSVAQDRGSSSRSASITKAALIRSGSDDSVPPLDNLTEDTATPEDDSSVSTFGSTVSSSRRSVFSKYWNATGQTPEPVTIRQRSDSCSPMSGQQPLRRSVIFSSSSHGSYNSLPGVLLPQPVSIGRKSVSVGDLSSVSNHRSRGPHKSCLRRDPQYSGENPLRRNTNSFSINEDDILADDSASISSSSVRFDLDATAIRHFKLPEEVHADEGWFNYFH